MAPQLPARTTAMSDNKPKQKSTPTSKHATTKPLHTTTKPSPMKTKPKDVSSSANKVTNPINVRDPFIAVDFEVHGRVQGVFFRKHALLQAEKLGVRGWCKNTEHGTVLGQLQGSRSKVEPMKKWLKSVGSPKSSIEKCDFRGEHEIGTITTEEFQIRR